MAKEIDLGGGATTPIRNREKKPTKKDWEEIEISLDDASFLVLAKEAHKQDITFNQLVTKLLRERMDAEDDKKEPN